MTRTVARAAFVFGAGWGAVICGAMALRPGDTPTLWMVLGLLGTLVGMLIALGGVVTASGAAELKSMVATLVEGMRIAIGTSIIGCIAALFIGVHRLAFVMATGADDDEE